MTFLRDPLILGPLSAGAVAVATFLLARSRYRAELAEKAASIRKLEAQANSISLDTFTKSIELLELRVSHLELESMASRAAWDYLAERVDPAVAGEARNIYNRVLQGARA